MVKIIAFDADDTLWENELYFHYTREVLVSLLSCFGTDIEILSFFEATERKNLKDYGYGVKSHTLSMIETALKISNNTISSDIISKLLKEGKDIFYKPLEIFKGVEETLEYLSEQFKLVVITKGDLLDQNKKLELSGLNKYLYKTFVVSEKREADYLKVISDLGCSANEFMMVGNSLPSDVLPVVEIGGYGVHIPHNYVCHYERLEKEIVHERILRITDIRQLKDKELLSPFLVDTSDMSSSLCN